jgi:hypothetical protein
MKWSIAVVAPLLCSLVYSQVPAAPPGGVKPKPAKTTSKKLDRVSVRAKTMRQRITDGQELKSHVKVRLRLANGNRLIGVVKDGRLVERVDGLRFVDAQARDQGAGIRLWYSGNTRSYIFIPFSSLRSYEVVQRLSQKQLVEMEKEMQMAEKRAKERAALKAVKAKQAAKMSAAGTGEGNPAVAPSVNGKEPKMIGGSASVPVLGAGDGTAKATVGQSTETATSGTKATPKLGPAKVDEKATKQELLWAELLKKYPPKAGWNEAKKSEISSRFVVIGAKPSELELEFVKNFDEWINACEHAGIDPNAGVVRAKTSKRSRRRP